MTQIDNIAKDVKPKINRVAGDRKTIFIDPEMWAKSVERCEKLRFDTFSDYVAHLIRQDIYFRGQ